MKKSNKLKMKSHINGKIRIVPDGEKNILEAFSLLPSSFLLFPIVGRMLSHSRHLCRSFSTKGTIPSLSSSSSSSFSSFLFSTIFLSFFLSSSSVFFLSSSSVWGEAFLEASHGDPNKYVSLVHFWKILKERTKIGRLNFLSLSFFLFPFLFLLLLFFSSSFLSFSEESQFGVLLDGRKLRTPAKQELVVPSELLSHLVAHEWNSQKDTLKPFSMPVVRRRSGSYGQAWKMNFLVF